MSPYAYLEKAAVLQEARCFNDSVVVRENPRKCCTVIAQLLNLQNTGQFLSSTEATEGKCGIILQGWLQTAHYVLVWRGIVYLHAGIIYNAFGVGYQCKCIWAAGVTCGFYSGENPRRLIMRPILLLCTAASHRRRWPPMRRCVRLRPPTQKSSQWAGPAFIGPAGHNACAIN